MADIVEKSAPAITSLGLIITKAKVQDEKQAERIITEIVRGWRHLAGENLAAALKEFGATRASAHLAVTWTGDFTLIHDIFDVISELLPAKARERKRDWWRQWKKKMGLAKS